MLWLLVYTNPKHLKKINIFYNFFLKYIIYYFSTYNKSLKKVFLFIKVGIGTLKNIQK